MSASLIESESFSFPLRVSWTILIIEDDEDIYEQMREALLTKASRLSITLKVICAKTLVEAKRMVRIHRPSVISTDMSYPEDVGARIKNWGGIHFLLYLKTIEKEIPSVIVYAGQRVEEVRSKLTALSLGRLEGKEVMIFQKVHGAGYIPWASAILQALHKK